MNTPRFGHTATLLPDGRLLVTGGADGTYHTLASAERFDPATGVWTPMPDMHTSRFWHTATLLPNGRLLVAGGMTGDASDPQNVDVVTSTETFDPASATWALTGNMHVARAMHSATLLRDGRVLVAGGATGTGFTSSAELYDPATGQWTLTGGMNAARFGHSATLLMDGRVLVTGGSGGSPLSSAEIYEPATGMWSLTAPMSTARAAPTATLLPDGRVLVVGSNSTAGTELYDPATGTWTSGGALNIMRTGHSATLLPDGRVLVAGGAGGANADVTYELFDPGLGFQPAWRPTINTTNSPLDPGDSLTLGGNGLRGYGYAEGSGGTNTNSATNYPLVQIMRLDNEQVRWLPPNPAHPFSASAFTSQPLDDWPAGYALVTVFVNGLPSQSAIVLVNPSTRLYLPLVEK